MGVWPGQWRAYAKCLGWKLDRHPLRGGRARPAFHQLWATGCTGAGASFRGCQMKTPRPAKAEQSAVNKRKFTGIDGFPTKLNTVTAEVLARLLNYERLTSLDAVADTSTTRLSAIVFYLRRKYGWAIESTDKAVGCRDGRVAMVSEYTMPAETIARAMAAGAAAWCADVRTARRARRTKAAEARRMADRANAARKTRQHPGQWGLFDGSAS